MPTAISESVTSVDTMKDMLRVDHVIASRHKFVAATPQIVRIEHEGQEIPLAVPSHCPACDFLVTSSVGDFLFLIGKQRPGQDGETHRGAVVVARRRKDGVYATELWHETHLSFVWRLCLETET